MEYKSEDIVREESKTILGFEDTETAKSGVGQLTSWTKLGFKGEKGSPDGWYLPNINTYPAIIAEFKANNISLNKPQVDELLKNCKIAKKRYSKVIGILWNDIDVFVYKDGERLNNEKELRNKEYYLGLYEENKIDTSRIYNLTKRINDSLHFGFGIKNLYHRMIFTACALVAKRYGAVLVHGMTFNAFRATIKDTLSKSYEDAIRQNQKLDILLDVYAGIKMNITDNQNAINDFIDNVSEISDNINSDFWNGEDVMAIFFNEFNRYKMKSESGQVFTPDHITSLMYRISNVGKDDIVLDAACGSGAFLVKSMCNMIKEAGGNRTNKAKEIKSVQLFGIEKDREIYALACANMLIHKDGKTNLEQMDSTTITASNWIKSKSITKVLMNPPFENKYKCLDIVLNILNSVPKDTACVFILPDKKLVKNPVITKRILKKHTVEKIIKIPEKCFSGVTTSIFVFKAGVPHADKDIFTCYIENDGLETVKNQGRQDVKNTWKQIEDKWVNIIHKQTGDCSVKWINYSDKLCYKTNDKPFSITSADFNLCVLKYVLFENNIKEELFSESILLHTLYGDKIKDEYSNIIKKSSNTYEILDHSNWKEYKISTLFEKPIRPAKRSKLEYEEGDTPFVASGNYNNGIELYVSPKDDDVTDKGGCITISPLDGSAFFQPDDFLGRGGAGSSIIILRLKNYNINKYSGLFLCAVLRSVLKKFMYSDMINGKDIQNEVILLPTTNSNTPDWQYMENFIKKIPYSKRFVNKKKQRSQTK